MAGSRRRDRSLAMGLGLALAALTADVAAGGRIDGWERSRLRAPGRAPAGWHTVTAAGDAPSLFVGVAAASLLAAARRRPVLRPGLTVLGGVLVRAALCRAVARPRPPRDWWQAEPTGPSFPSRHTTWASLAAGVVVDELPCAGRPVGGAAAAGLVAAVGMSRVRLGMHWPTDVGGGVLTALLCRAVSRLVSGA
ncbi:phosphatase PAP2 family protein [Segeticoccus rhizosphaerae]|uniref:phosphatase PAP2 family protein n=1 Tax=Segeticoccus rhizosphaerae TaxID=1104777 RepID=UPI0013904C46|nr:phosphatase PAP2 family protein [Ornithinicoccus soli]